MTESATNLAIVGDFTGIRHYGASRMSAVTGAPKHRLRHQVGSVTALCAQSAPTRPNRRQLERAQLERARGGAKRGEETVQLLRSTRAHPVKAQHTPSQRLGHTCSKRWGEAGVDRLVVVTSVYLFESWKDSIGVGDIIAHRTHAPGRDGVIKAVVLT